MAAERSFRDRLDALERLTPARHDDGPTVAEVLTPDGLEWLGRLLDPQATDEDRSRSALEVWLRLDPNGPDEALAHHLASLDAYSGQPRREDSLNPAPPRRPSSHA